MVRKADEILTDVLRSIGHSLKFYFEATPNLSISVDKGPGKEHCSRMPRLTFSKVAGRYRPPSASRSDLGLILIVVSQLVLKGSLAGLGPRSRPHRLRNTPLVKDFDTIVVEMPNARNTKKAFLGRNDAPGPRRQSHGHDPQQHAPGFISQ
jgi:hypothetical protein